MKKYRLRAPKFSVDYERDLNPQQLAVVSAGAGPILVIAGAGSGKTRTVVYRLARLIESGVDPSRILLLTFTNRAAREMMRRAGALIKSEIRNLWGGTFHHVGNLTLRRHARLIGYENNYTILDREDARDLLDACIAEAGIDVKKQRFPKGEVLLDIHSLSLNRQVPFQEVLAEKYPFFSELEGEIATVFARYAERKRRANAMDYDDLLVNWKLLLEEREDIFNLYSMRFKHILVDEYQDTNRLQADLVDLLAARHRNLMVVGDDAQSIYSFRGANFANIIDFPLRYPDARLFPLEINYRSTPEILALANSSINRNVRQFVKKLRATRPGGGKPALVVTYDSSEQARFVAQRLLELRDEGISLNETAVLYRSHYHSMELQFELTRRNIPFVVTSGLRFYEQRHIKDVTAYMRAALNPHDELAWKRILKMVPYIGNVMAARIWDVVDKNPEWGTRLERPELLSMVPGRARAGWSRFARLMGRLGREEMRATPVEMIEQILAGGYEDYLTSGFEDYRARLEDIRQLQNYASRFDRVESFLSELALLGTVEAEAPGADIREREATNLSTIHQAKGLEWRAVFIIWLAEDRFPPRSAADADSEEEERRLFYVAITRTKDQLYLCYPLSSERGFRTELHRPSRFLRELDRSTYEEWQVE